MYRARAGMLVTLLLLSASLSGCHSWKRHELPTSATSTAVANGRPVRVRLATGAEITLTGARVIGDSLVGDGGSPPQRFATALSDVRSIEERTASGGRTVALGLGATALVLVVGAAVGVLLLFSTVFGN